MIAFSLSAAVNIFQLAWQRKNRKTRPRDYTAQALLHDLLAGTALVKVTRIAPEDVLLRSPKDQM